MNRRRQTATEPPSGARAPLEPLPSLESRLDELQLQLDTLTRVARELRRQIDARKKDIAPRGPQAPSDHDRES